MKFTSALAAAAAVAAADVTTTTIGNEARLTDDGVVQGWTVSNLKTSTDAIPYPVAGTLWEATATDVAIEGSVTPIVSNLNARAANGETYRVLFGVATPQGVNPSTLSQGEKTTGKVYFDVVGASPDSVVYSAGGPDLLVWLPAPPQIARPYTSRPTPSTGSAQAPAASTPATPAPATPGAPAPAGVTTTTPEGAPAPGEPLAAGSTGTPLPAGSTGTPLPAGSAGTPLPAGSTGTPLPADASGTPLPAGSAGTPLPAGTPGAAPAVEGVAPVPASVDGPAPARGEGTPPTPVVLPVA